MADLLQQARAALERGELQSVFDTVNRTLRDTGTPTEALLTLLGEAFLKAGLPAEAAEAFETAATLPEADGVAGLAKAAAAAFTAGMDERGLLLALKAHRSDPDNAEIIYLCARALHKSGDLETLALFRNRLTASQNLEHLLFARDLIGDESRNPFNLVLFEKLARLMPDDPFIRFKRMSLAREFCDYPTIATEEAWMQEHIDVGDLTIFEGETPYSNLLHIDDERLNRLATNNRSLASPPSPEAIKRRRAMPHAWGERIRIGYLSGDFSSTHATMRLFRDVLEHHDPGRFDVTLFCYTPAKLIESDDGSRAGWGRIVPIHDLDDSEAAAKIRAAEIDILVDLKGHTGGSRCQILNHMAAPVQVAWLGYPGSTVNVDLDYVIGDRFVLPDSARAFYHEHFLRLPVSYQPNDHSHRPLPEPMSRRELGLPEDRFIFASFNAHRKISRQTLELWAKILRQAPESLLWAMVGPDQVRRNFLAALVAEGIDPARVVFADTVDYAMHIARLPAADLALDTFPYNGHTTTSDLLWAGVPVITKKGTNFASRVSESLLNAVGLADLVAGDEREYVDLANAFATGGKDLEAYRRALDEKRHEVPLFDSIRFVRDLEEAFGRVSDLARANGDPEDLDFTR
jgi:predicted O-linked N-acetylglucosamine transferase (SPINDLY family)